MNYWSLPGIRLPLLQAVTAAFGVTEEQLKSRSRHWGIVRARQAYFYLAVKSRDWTTLRTYELIGAELNRNYSTVVHSVKTVEADLRYEHIRKPIQEACQIARISGILKIGTETR